ncbi:hypothetical protein BDQ17DRAFT_1437464 [Cyathus striatus]|nr:hypothetical protein BDQ17DRAFT_1437464 [Cyathus striatus]
MSYSLIPLRRTDRWLAVDEERGSLFYDANDEQNFRVASGDQHSKVILKAPGDWTYGLRLFVFVVLEVSFIALAVVAIRHPLLLPSSIFDLKVLKGGFTVISIIWHSLAIIAIRPIIIQVVSSEWYLVGNQAGAVRIGRDDIVSTLTAGAMDHIRHPYTRKASLAYCFAMLLSFVLVALGGIGPGTVGVSTVLVNITAKMGIADLSHLSDMGAQMHEFINRSSLAEAPSAAYWMSRAERVIRMESIDGSTFRTIPQPNYIIPYAPQSSKTGQVSQGALYYRTDVVNFNYTCAWQMPQGDPSNQIYRTNYALEDIVNHSPAMFDESGIHWFIFPGNNWFSDVLMQTNDEINGTAGGVYQLFNATTSRTAFLFISGSNETGVPVIDLDGLPTVSTETIIPSGPNMAIAKYFPLSTMLVCDPQPNILRGTLVRGQGNRLDVVSTSGTPIENVPESGLNFMFSTALLSATTDLEASGSRMSFNSVVSSIFLTNRTYSSGTAELLPLETINENMNSVVLSASKAYSDGYRPFNDSSPFGTFPTLTTETIVQLQRTALITTRILFYVTVSLVSSVPVICSLLFTGWRRGKQYPFNLSSLGNTKDIKLL